METKIITRASAGSYEVTFKFMAPDPEYITIEAGSSSIELLASDFINIAKMMESTQLRPHTLKLQRVPGVMRVR